MDIALEHALKRDYPALTIETAHPHRLFSQKAC